MTYRPILALGAFAAAAFATDHPALAETPPTQPASDKPFTSMGVTPDDPEDCRAPRPPKDLAESAYTRNGYRAILRILAAEKWQETGSCDCFLTQLTWEEVKKNADRFRSDNDPDRPFDVSDLRVRADGMLAERDAACSD